MSNEWTADPNSIASLPPAVLESIPAQPPPPGIIPNFDHPDTLFPAFIWVLVVFSFFAITSYALRLYMRIILLKKWRWDDTTVTLGLIFTLIYLSAAICGIAYGSAGVHLWDIHLDRLVSVPNIYALYVTPISNSPALGFVKLSFLIQFYVPFKPLRWLRLFCWIGGSIIAFLYLSFSILALVLQSPWLGESFSTAISSWHYSVYAADLSIPIGVVGLVTDLFIIILPIPAVMGLQLAPKKKIGILLIFSLGLLAVVGSTMSLYCRVQLVQYLESQEGEIEFVAGYLLIWTEVELLAGITAVNIPVTHQFFVRKHIMQRIESSKLFITVKSLLSNTSHIKLNERKATHVLKDSFELDRASPQTDDEMEPDRGKTIDWKRGSLSEVQIMVSQEFTVTSYAMRGGMSTEDTS